MSSRALEDLIASTSLNPSEPTSEAGSIASSSLTPSEPDTRFTDYFNQPLSRDTAELILDWLLDRMIKNWQKYERPITASRYAAKYEGNDGNYGFDVHDPLNMAVPNSDDDTLKVLHYDPVIDKIPFLMVDRRDMIPGFSIWLPLMKASLLRSFITYRYMLESQISFPPVMEFTQVSFAHQVRCFSPRD